MDTILVFGEALLRFAIQITIPFVMMWGLLLLLIGLDTVLSKGGDDARY